MKFKLADDDKNCSKLTGEILSFFQQLLSPRLYSTGFHGLFTKPISYHIVLFAQKNTTTNFGSPQASLFKCVHTAIYFGWDASGDLRITCSFNTDDIRITKVYRPLSLAHIYIYIVQGRGCSSIDDINRRHMYSHGYKMRYLNRARSNCILMLSLWMYLFISVVDAYN